MTPEEEKKYVVISKSNKFAGRETGKLTPEEYNEYVAEMEAINNSKKTIEDGELTLEQRDIISRLKSLTGKEIKPYVSIWPAKDDINGVNEETISLNVDIDGQTIPITNKNVFSSYIYDDIRTTGYGTVDVNDKGFIANIAKGTYGNDIKEVANKLDIMDLYLKYPSDFKDFKHATITDRNAQVQDIVEPKQQPVIEQPIVNVPKITEQQQIKQPVVEQKPIVVQQPTVQNNPASYQSQMIEDQSPIEATQADDSAFTYEDKNPLSQIYDAKTPVIKNPTIKEPVNVQQLNQTPIVQPEIVKPITQPQQVVTQPIVQPKVESKPITVPIATPTQAPIVPPVVAPSVETPTQTPAIKSNVLAANAPYVPNRESEFEVTPEGAKLGIIQENGTIGHVNQSARPQEQWDALYDHFSKRYKSNREPKTEAERRQFVTQAYKADHDAGLITDNYEKSGYIKRKGAQAAPAQAAPAPKTAADIAQEAASTGKSFLQLYQESMPKPEYEQERADRIQTNSKASIIADILKLVGEGVTTKKGGTPIVRQSAVPMLNSELQKLNDLYKNEVRAYKQGGFNALLMDEQEKKRTAAVESARRAALQQTLLTQAAQAERETARQKATSEEKEKDRKFQAEQKAKDRSTTLTAAQIRKQDSENKSTTNEKGDILINGNIVKPKQAYVNDVAAKVKSEAKATDPVMGMSATEVFAANWNKYFDYVNGEFVPKGKSTTTGDPLNLGIKKTKSNPLGLNL